MFVDIFDSICAEHGLAPSRVLDEIGTTRSAYTRWKQGGEPSNETKKKIANYFGITVSQLMDGVKEKAPAEAEADDELLQILEAARNDPDKRILFSLSKNAKPQDVKKIIQMIKVICGDDDGRSDY